jgi:hypothetical protein
MNQIPSNDDAPGVRPHPSFDHPVFELLDKLRSSLRTGRKLHLDTASARVLLNPEIYETITRLEAEEMRKACARATANDNNLGSSGCGIGTARAHGSSAGLKSEVTAEVTSRGARQRLLGEVNLIARQGQRRTH